MPLYVTVNHNLKIPTYLIFQYVSLTDIRFNIVLKSIVFSECDEFELLFQTHATCIVWRMVDIQARSCLAFQFGFPGESLGESWMSDADMCEIPLSLLASA